MILPSLKDWFEGTFGASLQHKSPATVSAIYIYFLCLLQMAHCSTKSQLPISQGLLLFQPVLNSNAVQPPTLNEAFVEDLKSAGIPFSHDAEDRVFRAHGEACWEEAGSLKASHTLKISFPTSFFPPHILGYL